MSMNSQVFKPAENLETGLRGHFELLRLLVLSIITATTITTRLALLLSHQHERLHDEAHVR